MISTHLRTVNSGRLLVVFVSILCGAGLRAQSLDSTFWIPNGPVNSLVLYDSTVIIGGDFDFIAPFSGAFCRFDTTTALVDPNLFKVNGSVYATAMDDSGNIYVGGSFTRVGNTSVNHLFRIKEDGTFDLSFVHDVNGTVYCLAVHDTDLFIGGDFTTIDGESRSNFGGISLNTDLVNFCDPQVNGPVYCMDIEYAADMMIIGGDFTQVRNVYPPYLAKISMSTGAPLAASAVPWTATPNANGPVYDVQLDGFRLYLAGEFSYFASIPARGIAVLLNSDGSLSSYNAQVTGSVYTMEFADSSIYIGGNFTSVGGQARNNIACIDLNFNLRTGWNPGANGTVRTIDQMDKRRLFVGGDFSILGGDSCGRAAIVMKATAEPIDWDPKLNAAVYTSICDTFQRLYVGGEFFGAGGVSRNNLCAISVNTGRVTAWNPKVNAPVQSMTLDGDTLYFAGDFTSVNATARGRMAAIDLNTFSLLPFNPGVNGLVRTIATTNSTVYCGGNFTQLGGQSRQNIGEVSKFNSLATSWNPGCQGTVNSILPTPSWIYVAGYYSTIAGATRLNLCRLNPGTGAADQNWICNTDDGIYHAEFYNGKLVLGGWFNTVNNQVAPDFAFVDTTTLQVTTPAFNCDGFVSTFTRYGDDFFIAGNFQLVNSQFQPRMVAYDEGDDAIDPWAPFPNGTPKSLAATGTRIYMGGAMTFSAGVFHPYLQVMNVQWVTPVEEHIEVAETFSVFPVPASDFINVEANVRATAYTITDLSGKIVQCGHLNLNDGTDVINIAALAAGTYIITIEGENSVPQSQRFLRQ